MSDKEKKVLAMFEGSQPAERDLFDVSNVNHLAWTLLVLALGLIFWLCLALVNAENQRNAAMNNLCQDPVFKAERDARCMATIKSREHWWQHVLYAMEHVSP